MLQYKRIQGVPIASTMFAINHKSTTSNKFCQVFASGKDCVPVCLMKFQDEFETYFYWFWKENGVPVHLIVDAFSSQKNLSDKRFYNQVSTTLKTLNVLLRGKIEFNSALCFSRNQLGKT